MKNKYGALASLVYELDKPVGTSFGDVEYYLQRLKSISGPILEPGVGNGRFLIPLLQASKRVVGIDSSAYMLEHAQAALAEQGLATPLFLNTFESHQSSEPYDAIVMPAGTFQLVDSFDKAIELLAHFHTLLSDGGKLFIDIDPAHTIFINEPTIRKWSVKTESFVTLSTSRLITDYVAQKAIDLHRYDYWENGVLHRTEIEEFSLRWWGANELALAFNTSGFMNVISSGGYEFGRRPRSEDRVISIEGTKRA